MWPWPIMQTRCTWYRRQPYWRSDGCLSRDSRPAGMQSQWIYKTSLLWNSGHPLLHSNKNGSLSKLNDLISKLQNQPKEFEEYDQIIQIQLSAGIIKKAPKEVKEIEFYIPHKPVVKEEAESTKIRIIYNASTKLIISSPSVNKCLETALPPQNLLWNVLIQNHFSPLALCGHIKQAFLLAHIKEEDRDANRFHWLIDKDSNQIEIYRFTRILFGIMQSSTTHLRRNTYGTSWRWQGGWRNTEKFVRRWCHFEW